MDTETKNENVENIAGLRELADYLEAHPLLPKIRVLPYCDFWSKGSFPAFRDAMRAMGACKKELTDEKVRVSREFSGGIVLKFELDRDQVCKKIVTWDCGDSAMLAELGMMPEGVEAQ